MQQADVQRYQEMFNQLDPERRGIVQASPASPVRCPQKNKILCPGWPQGTYLMPLPLKIWALDVKFLLQHL